MKKIISLLIVSLLVSLFSTAQTRHLWCNATAGGAYGWGTILEGDSDGTNFHAVISFDSANGSYPCGIMVMAPNGKLFCTTATGGWGDSCVISCYDPASDTCTDIHDFDSLQQYGLTGGGGMILAPDGMLYGLCYQGGINNGGTIYRLDPNTYAYTDLHDFDTSGNSPTGELLLASDGAFYGVNTFGGWDNDGGLFRYNPTNGSYTVLHDFAQYPTVFWGGLDIDLIQASDGLLYGVTVADGLYGAGTIYSFDPVSLVYTDIYDFDTVSVPMKPTAGLVQGADGKLYGIANAAAPLPHVQMIYSYDIATRTVTATDGYDSAVGYGPQRPLSLMDNGKLITTNFYGGAHGCGSIISYDPATAVVTDLLDMDSATTGMRPASQIYENSVAPLAVQQILMKQISLSPNPSSDMITIDNTPAGTPLTVTDMSGAVILRAQTGSSSTSISIASLAPGIYFINGTKFVKE